MIQSCLQGFLVRRALQHCEQQLPGTSSLLSLSQVGVERYDAFGLQAWGSGLRRTHRSSIVVYEEPIELSSKHPPSQLAGEGKDSGALLYYDELNHSNSRAREHSSTPQRSRWHSPYESVWNKRILQEFYNVHVPVCTLLVKRTASRMMLDTAGTPLTQLQHKIKRSNSTSTKRSSDDDRLRRPLSKALDSMESLTTSKVRYQTPRKKLTPARRRPS